MPAAIIGTTMTTQAEIGLLQLMSWLSPAYPTGAFSYSHGLEWAVEDGLIRDRAGLEDWLDDLLRHGSGWSDAVLLACAHSAAARDDPAELAAVAELAEAVTVTPELWLETAAQGRAFLTTTRAVWPDAAGQLARLADAIRTADGPALPVAVGAAAAAHGLARDTTVACFLLASVSNLVSAAVRLVPLGQTDGQRAIATLAAAIPARVAAALACPLDELGTAMPIVEWCSMRHESQYTRLFRS